MSGPGRVSVIGGGRMGTGIAQVFAVNGAQVTIVEAADQDSARTRVVNGLARAHERGKLGETHPETIAERIVVVGGIEEIPADSDVVIEAVPEKADLKLKVLSSAEAVVGAKAVLASNTSSLSIAELGAGLRDPSRFLGMHFFNPVPASSMVEVVRAPRTAETTVDAVCRWVELLDKTVIVVNDAPGFATSRLGVALGLEAIRMVEEGVAEPVDIDTAMELGYRHPMGPLRSTDLVGLDVRLAIAEHLSNTLGARFEPPKLLRDKVSRGETGRKSGKGFYDWKDGD